MGNNMNILIIQHFGEIGGGARSAIDVAKMLKMMDHKVDFVFGHASEEFLELVKEQNLNVIDKHPDLPIFNFHNASGMAIKTVIRFWLSKKYMKEWYEFSKTEWKYDLVILNSSVLCPLTYVFNKLQIKNIVFVRETFRKNYLLNQWENIFLKKADAVTYLTAFDQNSWKANLVEYIIPDMVDSDIFLKDYTEVNNENNIFLYVGGLNYYKGALDLLKAIYAVINDLKGIDINVYFLGNTYEEYEHFSFFRKCISHKHVSYRTQCIKYINKINDEKEIIFLKGIQKNIATYYQICDALIFPVKKVHQPKPVYEAGYYGKPVVVPDYDNFKENIIDGYNGYMYAKNDVMSLKKALIEIILDKKEAKKRGMANREFTIKKHSSDSVLSLLEDVVNDITQSSI